MSRTLPTIVESLAGKLPPGWALAKRDGVLGAILRGVSSGLFDAEASAEALMSETDPRTANALLADFERILGSDPCGADLDGITIQERRLLAHGRWTATGGQSIPYLISVAAKRGYTIEIEEFWPTKVGNLRAGHRLKPEGIQFVWRVKLGLTSSFKFRAGEGRAGQPLGFVTLSGIECELRRIAHAHTLPVFSYTTREAA